MIDLYAREDDDLTFLAMTASAITGVREQSQPASFRLIRIDNWFGPKWHRFSGKAVGAVGIAKHRLTIPPFVPSRVDEETVWHRVEDGYERCPDFAPTHRAISSEENLRRYLDLECPDSTLFWFSGRSKSNGRGSIMVYATAGVEEPASWYVELNSMNDWRPSVAEGISAKQFCDLVSTETTEA